MRAAQLMVKALENEGVQYIFGIPGEENLDFLEALRQSKQIKFILTRHEQAAGFMAATYGRLTGEPGVCLSTLGPGATNLITAAAFANLGAMPMVLLTGQKPIKENKQGQFQILDIVDVMNPVTKYSKQVINANAISYDIRQAFRIAREERPGASHLEVPEDIIREEVASPHVLPPRKWRMPTADDHMIRQTCDLICKAKHPLIMLAAGANRIRTGKAILQFIEKTNIPFFTTQMGKGVVDERCPAYLGNATMSSGSLIHEAIQRADLIINVGHDITEKPPFIMEADGKQVVHVNYYTADVDKLYFPQIELTGDIAGNIEQLAEHICPNKESWNFDYFHDIKIQISQKIDAKKQHTNFPVLPQYLVHTVREMMPEDGIVTLDNGMYKLWFAHCYPCYQANTLLLDNALASMGAGLPAAIGAKITHPDRKVIAVCGDGGFMMNSQELETAVRLQLDIIVLIINDAGLGMIQWKQKDMNFTDFGLSFQNPDFVKYAESYGAKGYQIQDTKQLQPLLQECLETKGVHLIDIPIDYSENESFF